MEKHFFLLFSPAWSSRLLRCISSASSSWPLLWLPVEPAGCSTPVVPVRGASTATGPRMLQSGGRRFLLLGPPRTIQSGASSLSGAAWPRLPCAVAPRPWLCGRGAHCPGLRHPAADVAWHLSLCRGCGRRRASLACLVAPRGAPRLVRSGRSRCSGRLSRRRGAFPHPRGFGPPDLLGGCAGHVKAGREPGSLCLPLAPAEAGALGSLRVVPIRGPAMGLSLAGPSGFGLRLRALRWLACLDPVTEASGFPYRRSFEGGLCRCTGADSCGRRHLPFRVGGRHARVPCVCACARPSWPGRAGRSPGRVLVRLPFSSGRSVFLLSSAPSGLGLPLSWSFVCRPLVSPPPLFFSFLLCFFCRAPPLSLAFSGFRPRVAWALALCAACSVGLPLLGSPCSLASFVFPSQPLAAPWWLLPPPPLFVSRGFRRCLSVLGFFFFRCMPPFSLAFAGLRPRVPWALALWVVCFVGLPLLCSPCPLTSFVCPASPLAALWWLLPPPPLLLLCKMDDAGGG